MKKKLLFLSLLLIMALCLSSCGMGPSKTVETYLQALKDKDIETASELYAGDVEFYDDILDEAEDDDSELTRVTAEELVPKLLEFDYEVVSEEKDGDKATVQVKITAYPIGAAYKEFVVEYFTQAFALAFSGGTEEDFDKLGASILSEKLADCDEKTFEKTVPIKLKKVDGKWIISKYGNMSKLGDALVGGLFSTQEDINDVYGE